MALPNPSRTITCKLVNQEKGTDNKDNRPQTVYYVRVLTTAVAAIRRCPGPTPQGTLSERAELKLPPYTRFTLGVPPSLPSLVELDERPLKRLSNLVSGSAAVAGDTAREFVRVCIDVRAVSVSFKERWSSQDVGTVPNIGGRCTLPHACLTLVSNPFPPRAVDAYRTQDPCVRR